MKIFSDIQVSPDNTPFFVLYLDTQKTGDQNKDTAHCAMDMSNIDMTDPDQIISLITPLLTNLVYTVYGKPPAFGKLEPLTDINTTGFDKNA